MQIELDKTVKFIDWLKKMIFLNTKVQNAGTRNIYRGQVYFCELGEGIGSEESKERPCIILQNNLGNKNSQNTIVAPITNGGYLPAISVTIPNNVYSYRDNEGNLKYLSGNILLANIVTISKARIGNYICDLSKDKLMEEVNEKIIVSLGLFKIFDNLKNTISSDKKAIKRLIEKRDKLTEEKEDLEKEIDILKKELEKK